jgi:hypothetical protein
VLPAVLSVGSTTMETSTSSNRKGMMSRLCWRWRCTAVMGRWRTRTSPVHQAV